MLGGGEVGARLELLVALGASLVPAPGLRHCRQRLDSLWRSNPGGDMSTDADPDGKAQHTTRSCSPVASASS
eukprot:8209952-Pyramimonas_sp.AAC.1